MPHETCDVAIIGGGLVGSLQAIFMAKRGRQVNVFEKRPDMRKATVEAGRSINLVMTSRGLHALELLGLKEELLEITMPVYGRMMHSTSGEQIYQAYSRDNTECNYSVSRGELNQKLIQLAEDAGARFYFEHDLTGIDFDHSELQFDQFKMRAQLIFGADGAGSKARQALMQHLHSQEQVDFIEHGYKEFLMPANSDGSYPLQKDALHIWPRGEHMLMALPNTDGSFTMTLYLPFEGKVSFEALKTKADVTAYFEKYFADSIPLMPNYLDEFFENPTGKLGTVRCYPWHFEDKCALIGDAAHAIVPFFGQGMNAGFEDCSLLYKLMNQHADDWKNIFSSYSQIQKVNGDAIADMALENFIEMRDKVGDQRFLLEKQVEAKIGNAFPGKYLSRYSLVTHSLVEYHHAQAIGKIQKQILAELCQSIDKPEAVDLQRAEQLIEEKLTPYHLEHKIQWEP